MGSVASGRPEVISFRLRTGRGRHSHLKVVSWWSRAWALSSPFTKEQVVCIWTRPSDLEDLHHVKELAVDIAHDSHRRSYVHNITLLHKEFFGFGAYCFDDRLGQQLLFRQPRYALIKVYSSCARLADSRTPPLSPCAGAPRTRKPRHGSIGGVVVQSGGIDGALRVSRPR